MSFLTRTVLPAIALTAMMSVAQAQTTTDQDPETQARTPWYRTWTGLAGLGAAALAAVYLSLFHVDHVLDALPLVLLLLCPLMHVFMHGGHGHGGHGDADRPNKGGSP